MTMLFLSGCVGNEKTNIQNNSQSNQINAGIPTPVPKTIILEPVDEESGSVYDRGKSSQDSGVWNTNIAGDEPYSFAKQTQAFISYNMAVIPANATITKATMDLGDYRIREDPFSGLGCLGVYEQDFGVPDTNDFFLDEPTDAIVKWCSVVELSKPSESKELMSALKSKLGNKRFQVRMQFDKISDDDGKSDGFDYFSPRIFVTYTK